MKGMYLDRSIRSPMGIPRAGLLAVAIGSAILATAATLESAGAQEALSSPATTTERDQAPIGHRQPRPEDLPRAVVRDENRVNADEHAFDKKLEDSMCRGC
jgi:hypothetical protein